MGNALCCHQESKDVSLSSQPATVFNTNHDHRNGQHPSSSSPPPPSEKKNNSPSPSSSPYHHNHPSSSSSLNPHLHPSPHSRSYNNSNIDNNNNNSQQPTSQHHLLHPTSSTSSSSRSNKKNKRDRRPTNGSLSPSNNHSNKDLLSSSSAASTTNRRSNSHKSNVSSSTGGHIQFTTGPGKSASDLSRTHNLERAMERNNISPDYQWLDGRRYHNNPDASYLLPNDIDEVDRLQLQHFILRYAIQGNFKSPLDKSKVRTILDVGCGPGTWTMEMANEFPDATVTGIDLSSVFPSAIIPGNCRFLQHNILEPLPFPDNHFDFVYQRLLISGLTVEGWAKVIKEFERVTKPGGWIELVECDSHGGNNGPHSLKIWNWITTALGSRGIDSSFTRDPGLECALVKSGVENVTMLTLKLPTGKFGGKIGQLLKENLFAFWNAITPMIVHGAGADKVEYEEALRKAEREVEEYKSYHIFYVATGQKREDGAVAL